jgi:hypothetical protein
VRIKGTDGGQEARGGEQASIRRRRSELMYVDVRLVNDGDA